MARSKAKIMDEICRAYEGLEPENLCCDGEASLEHQRYFVRIHHTTLKRCFKELGRVVTEQEVFQYFTPKIVRAHIGKMVGRPGKEKVVRL